MSTAPRRRRSKKFLQEIVEPEVQESFQDQEADVNWDDLNDRQREEIIQAKREENARLA